MYANRSDAETTLRLPRFRGWLICRVRLREGAGRIQQTGRETHHTWWPLAGYDILAHCDM